MAFRATKASEYGRARDLAKNLKQFCQTRRDEMAAGTVSASVLRELIERLVSADTAFSTIATVSGIGAYAQSQEGDPNYNVATEFSAMRAAVQAARNWIINNIPTSGGYVLLEQFTTAGVSQRTFSTSQTAGLRTQLDSLIATID